MSLEAFDRPQRLPDPGGLHDGGQALRLHRGKRPAKVDRHVAAGRPDATAKRKIWLQRCRVRCAVSCLPRTSMRRNNRGTSGAAISPIGRLPMCGKERRDGRQHGISETAKRGSKRRRSGRRRSASWQSPGRLRLPRRSIGRSRHSNGSLRRKAFPYAAGVRPHSTSQLVTI